MNTSSQKYSWVEKLPEKAEDYAADFRWTSNSWEATALSSLNYFPLRFESVGSE